MKTYHDYIIIKIAAVFRHCFYDHAIKTCGIIHKKQQIPTWTRIFAPLLLVFYVLRKILPIYKVLLLLSFRVPYSGGLTLLSSSFSFSSNPFRTMGWHSTWISILIFIYLHFHGKLLSNSYYDSMKINCIKCILQICT